MALLTSPDPNDRHRAKYKRGGLTPDDRHFFPDLVTGARSPDERVRFMSLAGLKRLEHFPRELLPLIGEALLDPIQAVRQSALMIAPRFDPPDDDIVSRVTHMLANDPERFVRTDAAGAAGELVAMGATAAIADLIAATRDDDEFVRRHAVIAIKLLGRRAQPAEARMWELSRDGSDRATQIQAAAALRAMGAEFG